MARSEEKRRFLANQITRYRKLHGMTQQQVADYLEIQRPTYAYKENGKTDISIELLIKLSNLYQVDLNVLTGTVNPSEADQLHSNPIETRQERELHNLIRGMDMRSKEALLAFLKLQADGGNGSKSQW